jgi:hypothetical protein
MKPLDFLEHFLPVNKLLLEHLANNDDIIKKLHAGFITNVPQDGLYQAFEYFWSITKAKKQKCELPHPLSAIERCLLLSMVQGNLPGPTLQIQG